MDFGKGSIQVFASATETVTVMSVPTIAEYQRMERDTKKQAARQQLAPPPPM